MVRDTTGRPYWPSMQPWDFDASLPAQLDIPADLPGDDAPLSDGADLLALLP